MTNGANILNYNLYTTAANTTIWGDGTSGTSYLNPANSNGLTAPGVTTLVVHGLIPAQALPAAGTYTDTIMATLTCTNGGACTTAATQTLFVPVIAQVGATCSVASSDMNFGNYTGGTVTPTTGLATVTANCPMGAPYAIGLSEGLYPGATTTTRRMTITDGGGSRNGGDDASLSYGLYSDAAGTINWGNNFNGAVQDVVQGTGTGADQEILVYGRIGPGQNVRTGLYEDTILVTMQF
jgi:spore coat protein U-like protein